MSRVIDAEIRADLEATASPHVQLVFVMIEHANLPEPLRFVSDALDYMRDGELWQGVLFNATLPGESDEAPAATLTIPNTNPAVGAGLRTLVNRAWVTLDVVSSADFDVTVEPRVPLGGLRPIYPAIRYELVDISCNAAEVSGRLMTRDFAQEPWPCVFATQSRFPGLFR